jgi:hypothetical protein
MGGLAFGSVGDQPETQTRLIFDPVTEAFRPTSVNGTFWHLADIPEAAINVRFWGKGGHCDKVGIASDNSCYRI